MTTHADAGTTVREWMKPRPFVTHPRDSIDRARALCEEHRINQLPVVAGDRLVGIITDRDLRDAFPSIAEQAKDPIRAHRETAATTVEDVMTRDVLTVADTDSIRHAASVMEKERVSALPVLQDGQLVGIITRSDLLRALLALLARTSA